MEYHNRDIKCGIEQRSSGERRGAGRADVLGAALLGAKERIRVGIPGRGESVGVDVKTGGSAFAYTRIKQLNNYATGLHWKRDRLLRVDAISYKQDMYGDVSGRVVETERAPDISEWQRNAQQASNETLFKHELSYYHDLDAVVLAKAESVDEAIKIFTDAGITELPDGRKIKDVILTKRRYTTKRGREAPAPGGQWDD